AYARRWLEARGYVVIGANWRCRGGEIDLVARDGAELVFVEVKTRRGEGAGRAEEAVTPAKARRLLASGAAFIAAHPAYADAIWRIDLLAITLDSTGAVARVAHLPNAVVSG
ncbi:MAG TPA: YraN family protein, partial [Thermomicrobiales bacterium]|nr:YraN family protein [Thermomicrobiales bacterium]